jgi:hypothetical protein
MKRGTKSVANRPPLVFQIAEVGAIRELFCPMCRVGDLNQTPLVRSLGED